MREIEIKFKAPDSAQILQHLQELGCVLSEPVTQHDTLYSYNGSTKEWDAVKGKVGQVVMRIRRQGNTAVFNLKQQLTSEMDNIETETEVGDADAINKILGIIGYTPQVEVKKTRQKCKYNGYEICVDTVEQLGSFVEVEKLTDDDADPLQVRGEIFKVAGLLGLSPSDEEALGYDTQIFQLRNGK
jgi:adenylate cyclase class 2